MYVKKVSCFIRAKKVVHCRRFQTIRPSSLGTGRTDELDEFYEDDVFKESFPRC